MRQEWYRDSLMENLLAALRSCNPVYRRPGGLLYRSFCEAIRRLYSYPSIKTLALIWL